MLKLRFFLFYFETGREVYECEIDTIKSKIKFYYREYIRGRETTLQIHSFKQYEPLGLTSQKCITDQKIIQKIIGNVMIYLQFKDYYLSTNISTVV